MKRTVYRKYNRGKKKGGQRYHVGRAKKSMRFADIQSDKKIIYDDLGNSYLVPTKDKIVSIDNHSIKVDNEGNLLDQGIILRKYKNNTKSSRAFRRDYFDPGKNDDGVDEITLEKIDNKIDENDRRINELKEGEDAITDEEISDLIEENIILMNRGDKLRRQLSNL